MGQLGSGQEVFKCHGSGQVTLFRPDPREVIRHVEKTRFFYPPGILVPEGIQ